MSDGYETLGAKFVVKEQADQIKAQAMHIRELQRTLRWIVKSCDVKIHRLGLFDEIREHARNALPSED